MFARLGEALVSHCLKRVNQGDGKKRKQTKKTFFFVFFICVRCVRLTYPIQEAADPKDHFPLGHQTADRETERESKQIQLGHLFPAPLPSKENVQTRMRSSGEPIPEKQGKKKEKDNIK